MALRDQSKYASRMATTRAYADSEGAPVASTRRFTVAERHFECRCDDGHTSVVATPDDEGEARRVLGRAHCRCGAAFFTAVERLQ